MSCSITFMAIPAYLLPVGALPSTLDWDGVRDLSTRYALQVSAIDRQHAILFGWYVWLKTAPDVRPTLEGLRAYAEGHFHDEEQWALSHGLDILNHQEEHAGLLRDLDELLQRPKPSRIEAQAFVYDWLTCHIDSTDRAMVLEATLV